MTVSDDFVLHLTDVWRLSVAYIGPNSRTERPRKTKIGTEVAHVTLNSDTTFKVKGDVLNSQHAGTGATWRINTKILSTCRGQRHIVSPYAQLVLLSRGSLMWRPLPMSWPNMQPLYRQTECIWCIIANVVPAAYSAGVLVSVVHGKRSGVRGLVQRWLSWPWIPQ